MEYLLVIFEFYKVKGKSNFFYVGFPIVLYLLILWYSKDQYYIQHASDFQNSILTVLGILIGFSVSVFTMLLTVDNENIRKAKGTNSDRKLYGKDVSLFNTVLIGLAYLIVIQGVLLIGNLIYPLFTDPQNHCSKLIFSLNISLLVHTILLLMRSILDFYFIITGK